MLEGLRQAVEDFKAALGSDRPAKPRASDEPAPTVDAAATRYSEADCQSSHIDATAAEPRVATDQPQTELSVEAAATGDARTEQDRPSTRGRGFSARKALVAITVLGVAWLIWHNLDGWLWPEPADTNAVATYAEGTVTKEDLLASLDSHPESQRKALSTPEGLRHLIQDIAVHRVVELWAKERQLDQKDSVQHAMKHAAEEVNLHDVTDQIHQGQVRVDEGEIQRYYEENRDRLGGVPLAEVRDFIRETLHADKEKEYVEGYLRDLRAKASVTVDYQLLAVPQPSEEELYAYYLSHQAEFREPEPRRFDEAREEIRRRVEAVKAASAYSENKTKTLFTLRGRRFTLGEFLEEYEQFPPDLQARYRDFDGKKLLVDRLIERLLVLDSASSQMLDVKNKKEMEDARRHILAQILHQEEMQGKLQASDEEVNSFYQQHSSHYIDPLRVKISYIRVGMGGTQDSRQRARERIDEAARRLQAAKDRPEAFAEMAKEFSEDPETASKGGDLDRWLAGSDDPFTHAVAHDFTEAIFGLKVGEMSPVIAMGDSFYIVRVRERQDPKSLPTEQAKALAKEDLLAEKHERALQEMETELARRMRLVIYDNRVQGVLAGVAINNQQPAVGNLRPAGSDQQSGISDQQPADHSSHR